MQDVTKQELTVQLKQAEDAREGAETALKEAQTALDAANTELATLREQVAKVAPLEAELADLRTNFDSKIVEARKELVSSAQEHEWKAARAENAAKETLQDAQRQFGARGQQILLDFVQTLVEQFNIPEPDPSALPNGISPLVLTLWGHSAVRAQLMIAYAKSFPEPSDNFKQTLLHCLKASLPVYEGMVQPDPITDFADKVSVLTAMAAKWGVLTDIQKLLEEAQIQRQANFLRNHYAMMQAEEHASALRGEGRTEIGVEEKSITGCPLSEHLPGCLCKACGGNVARLPNSMDEVL